MKGSLLGSVLTVYGCGYYSLKYGHIKTVCLKATDFHRIVFIDGQLHEDKCVYVCNYVWFSLNVELKRGRAQPTLAFDKNWTGPTKRNVKRLVTTSRWDRFTIVKPTYYEQLATITYFHIITYFRLLKISSFWSENVHGTWKNRFHW